jgi:hypothetical protein
MPDLTAKRTLVKSPPELWEELSEVEGLAKHLGAFGEIKITKLEPEHTVAWEGEHASGTVSIEPSGWGTKVTLHAELSEATAETEAEADPVPAAVAAEPEPEPVAEPEPEPVVEPEPVAEPEPVVEQREPASQRRGFWGWLFRPRTGPPVGDPGPVAKQPDAKPVVSEPEPEPVAIVEELELVVEEPAPIVDEPEPVVEDPGVPGNGAVDPDRARLILDEALDALGAAHHRPFSRG